MKRDPIRVALALVLIASAMLFVAGSIVERSHSATAATPAAAPAPVTTTVTASTLAAPSLQAQGAATAGEGSAQHETAEHAPQTVLANPTTETPSASPSHAVPAVGTLSSPALQTPAEGSARREAAERTQRAFGLNLESPALVATAAAGTLLLAVAALAWRRRAALWAIAVFAFSFSILDVREMLVQAGTGRSSVVALAGALAVVHLAATAVAVVALVREGRLTVRVSS